MGSGVSEDLVDVHLVGLPVPVHQRAVTHMRALERELDLIRRRDPDQSSIPHRLHALIDELNEEFGGVGEQPVVELDAAVDRGDAEIDLVYRLPPSVGAASRRLADLLDEVDDYCRRGDHLLTLVTPEDALRYRRWFLSEFVRQTAGAPPVPWPAYRDDVTGEHPDPDAADAEREIPLPPGWTLEDGNGVRSLSVSGPVDLVSAPALRDALASLVTEQARVRVDLTRCDFLDSVGVSVLVAAIIRAQERQATLSFELSEETRQVLRISGLLDRMELDG
jgi:anti-anti-sigma factor